MIYCIIFYYSFLYSSVLYCVALYSIVLYGVVLYCIVLYCIVYYITVLCYAILNNIDYDFKYIFGAVCLIFEASDPRESPCGTPDGRLGLPRRPVTSLGRGGGGVGEDFQPISGSPKDTFLVLLHHKYAQI